MTFNPADFEPIRRRALDEQPQVEVTKIMIVAIDAEGGTTRVQMSGENMRMEAQGAGHTYPELLLDRPTGRQAIVRPMSPKVGGTFSVQGFEHMEASYTEPPRPEPRFKKGDIVRLPRNIAPVGIPYRNVGPVVQVDVDPVWGDVLKVWHYHFLDRQGANGFQLGDSPELDGSEVLEDWPLRKGDFVTFADSLNMSQFKDVFKLGHRIGPANSEYDADRPAWWLEDENGPTGTFLYDDHAKRVEVEVVKTQSWKRV